MTECGSGLPDHVVDVGAIVAVDRRVKGEPRQIGTRNRLGEIMDESQPPGGQFRREQAAKSGFANRRTAASKGVYGRRVGIPPDHIMAL